ncbi:MAG: Asp-tRNA(Asn)/Glu-tRNA(Gln) amidotransferase subunit GatB [Elusimicrobiota bacterium]
MKYEAVIGLEVHAQLSTNTKIFCGCSTKFGMPPNSNVCPVCTGMPGVLPVLNKMVVENSIRAALAFECGISPVSVFARKQYFYPDLPKNFQISQYELPLAEHGKITLENGKNIGITRIHLEEDAGKLLHNIGSREIDGSLVDYNRTGVPLIEIVSEPDIRTPDDAYEYLTIIKSVLQYIEVSDCNMDEGSLRCDANVSIRPLGREKFGTKVEMKNMNSFKGVQKALAYEIERQREVLDKGGTIIQETRLWDDKKEITVTMRTKEEAHDYRYFPEPDLLPLKIDKIWIDNVRKNLPELPKERKARFIEEYTLSGYDAGVLTKDKKLADYFETALKDSSLGAKNAKSLANWVMGELLGRLNLESHSISESPVKAPDLAKLVILIQNNTISGKIAKMVFDDMYKTGKTPDMIIKEKNLVQITDESAIALVVDEVIAENVSVVEEFKKGKGQAIGFLVGQVMKKSKGKANPQMANELLKEKLK